MFPSLLLVAAPFKPPYSLSMPAPPISTSLPNPPISVFIPGATHQNVIAVAADQRVVPGAAEEHAWQRNRHVRTRDIAAGHLDRIVAGQAVGHDAAGGAKRPQQHRLVLGRAVVDRHRHAAGGIGGCKCDHVVARGSAHEQGHGASRQRIGFQQCRHNAHERSGRLAGAEDPRAAVAGRDRMIAQRRQVAGRQGGDAAAEHRGANGRLAVIERHQTDGRTADQQARAHRGG